MKRFVPIAAAALAACLGAWAACSSDDGPPPVTTCDGLCDRTPDVTPAQDDCIRVYLTGLGYPITTTLQCLGFTSPAGCRICYDTLGPTDDNCAQAWSACPP